MELGFRFGFLGTTEFAAAILDDLIANNKKPLWVITKPDSIAGRGQKLRPSPVKKIALGNDIPIYQPDKIDQAFLENFQHDNPEVMLVVAYGIILPTEFLNLAPRGCVNIHTSLLPRWRGAAPIERSIQAGDEELGISLIKVTPKLDAGPIIMQKKFKSTMGDTAADITPKLNDLAKDSINEYLNNPDACPADEQEEEQVTYAQKITKEEAQIDWAEDAVTIARKINAFNPSPGAYSWLGSERLKLLKAIPYSDTSTADATAGELAYTAGSKSSQAQLIVTCGKGKIEVLQLQLPGRSPININQIQGKSILDTSDTTGEKFTNSPQ